LGQREDAVFELSDSAFEQTDFSFQLVEFSWFAFRLIRGEDNGRSASHEKDC